VFDLGICLVLISLPAMALFVAIETLRPLSGLSARCGVFSVSLSVAALTIQSFSWARGAGGRQRDRSHR